ncbi:hypothetical protein EMIT0P253_290005 [Pseudomonas sp. IT-P253]
MQAEALRTYGQIVVDSSGTGYPEIVLWSDTSPDVAEIEVLFRSGSTLKIWNVWKSTFGMKVPSFPRPSTITSAIPIRCA